MIWWLPPPYIPTRAPCQTFRFPTLKVQVHGLPQKGNHIALSISTKRANCLQHLLHPAVRAAGIPPALPWKIHSPLEAPLWLLALLRNLVALGYPVARIDSRSHLYLIKSSYSSYIFLLCLVEAAIMGTVLLCKGPPQPFSQEHGQKVSVTRAPYMWLHGIGPT